MELKVIERLSDTNLNRRNPFNGIERRGSRGKPGSHGKTESIQWNWKLVALAGLRRGVGWNPFNGIERASSTNGLTLAYLSTRIHSMELKDRIRYKVSYPVQNIESIQWNWKFSLPFSHPLFLNIKLWIHSMELKATTQHYSMKS